MKTKTKTTVKQIILLAARLVSKGWTRDAYARDRRGKSVKPTDPKAVRFCALGALDRACEDLDPGGALLLPYDRVTNVILVDDLVGRGRDDTAIQRFNDRKTTTQADVVKVLRRAARGA